LLLEDGKTGEARAVAEKIATLNPSPTLIQDAARALIGAEQYDTAKEFIARVGADAAHDLRLDLAIADSHTVDAIVGLEEMNRIPASERDGDYYLALAAMLERAGHATEATAAWKHAIEEHPTRPDLYRDLAALFIKDHRAAAALQVLDQGTRSLPEDIDLSMMKDALEASLR
jgi:tetratricopeptide (TPR) repeat protein